METKVVYVPMANKTTPIKESHITSEMLSIDKAITEHTDAIERLFNHFTSVLTPMGPENLAEKNAGRPQRSDLADSLAIIAKRIADNTNRINELIQRCEL